MNRLDAAQRVVSFRSVASTEASDDHDLVAKDPLHSNIERPPLNLCMDQLSVSLRI